MLSLINETYLNIHICFVFLTWSGCGSIGKESSGGNAAEEGGEWDIGDMRTERRERGKESSSSDGDG